MNKNTEPFPKKLYDDPAFLQQKYVAERLSIKEISRLTFSSRWLVRKRLRAASIELRNQKQRGKTKSQPGFGEAWRRNKVLLHKREVTIIEKMKGLREERWSYGKIAELLNSWGIKKKTQKGTWTGKQVQQTEKLRKSQTPRSP